MVEKEVDGTGGYVAITFRSYLTRLREIERAKPKGERRTVPTVHQISKFGGIKPTTASRLMNGYVTAVSLDKLAIVLNVMNQLGFDTKVSDFFTYEFNPKGTEGLRGTT